MKSFTSFLVCRCRGTMQILLLAVQDLCDLNRIQGGAFQKLIAAEPLGN